MVRGKAGRERGQGAAGAGRRERRVVDHVDGADQAVGAGTSAQRGRDPLAGNAALAGDALFAELAREPGEIETGTREDRREARVEHPELALAREPGLVPADGRAVPDEREEAAIVLVARPLGGVDGIRVAPVQHRHLGQHAPQRPVPLERVVASRFPGVDEHRLAEAVRVALGEQEAVPGVQRAEQRAGAALVRVLLEHEPGAARGERRLGDAGDAAAVDREAPAPPARSRQVARVRSRDRGQDAPQAPVQPVGHARVKRDVREHPAGVARPGKRLELGPGALRVELRPAERGERGVPVPLVRVGRARRDGVAAVVVMPQHPLGGGGHARCGHGTPARSRSPRRSWRRPGRRRSRSPPRRGRRRGGAAPPRASSGCARRSRRSDARARSRRR